MSIKSDIESWDGKSIDDIQSIFDTHKLADSFVEELIKLVALEDCQKGATWLLKRSFESGIDITPTLYSDCFNLLGELNNWESKLHVLQCLPYMQIPKPYVGHLVDFLRELLTDQNKFVRAWAYNGMYEVSKQYPEFESETKRIFAMAMRDEAASVKARIRNIYKKGF